MKQNIEIGARKECEETLFRNVMVLENEITEKEKDLCEAGQCSGRAALEWRSFKAKEQRDSDAVESGVAWKTASGPEAPVRRSTCLRLASAGRPRGRTNISGTVLNNNL